MNGNGGNTGNQSFVSSGPLSLTLDSMSATKAYLRWQVPAGTTVRNITLTYQNSYDSVTQVIPSSLGAFEVNRRTPAGSFESFRLAVKDGTGTDIIDGLYAELDYGGIVIVEDLDDYAPLFDGTHVIIESCHTGILDDFYFVDWCIVASPNVVCDLTQEYLNQAGPTPSTKKLLEFLKHRLQPLVNQDPYVQDCGSLPPSDYSENLTGNSGSGSYRVGAIESEIQKGTIEASPNPFRQNVKVKVTQTEGPVFVTIVSMEGKMLYKKVISGEQEGQTFSIPTGSWSAGIYQLRLQGKGYSTVEKIVKY